MKITKLQPQRRSSRRVSVFLDGVFLFGLARDTVTALGLHEGQEVDRADLDGIAREEQLRQCRDYAFLLLSYRARTEDELRKRLARKGFPPDVADVAIVRLKELKMIDDAGFARQFAEDRVKVGHKGKWRVRAELTKRGVAREQIDEALAGAPDETAAARSEVERYRKRNSRLEPAVFRRRLYAYLARRGFSPDTIRLALGSAGEEMEPDSKSEEE
jgi:regulatory protein